MSNFEEKFPRTLWIRLIIYIAVGHVLAGFIWLCSSWVPSSRRTAVSAPAPIGRDRGGQSSRRARSRSRFSGVSRSPCSR